MVFRYWGQAHADVQQFAPLVDRRAGGIADDVLVAAVRDRGWSVVRAPGSFATLRATLDAGSPVILLLEDRLSRYHYVVAVGATAREVVVHDPTWGPNRRLAGEQFLPAWQKANFWMAVVTPGTSPRTATEPDADRIAPGASARADEPGAASREGTNTRTPCEAQMDAALTAIDRNGLAVADAELARVRAACPAMAAPVTELAGVRFRQSRWRDAADLASEALRLAPTDRYTWDLLASSRFLQGDVAGALTAWNAIGRPALDLVQIDGLRRTRYAHLASVMDLAPNTPLTPRAYGLAARHLEDLPDRVASRLSLRPQQDGYATVTATVQETAPVPASLVAWGVAGLQAGFDREVTARLPGGLGMGELWSVSWRWWRNRPRVAASFAAPVAGRLGGVWRVEGFWEAQTYRPGGGADLRQTQRAARLSWGRWLTPHLRGEVRAGADAWDGGQRTALVGGSLEQRLFGDRLTLTGIVDRWTGMRQAPSFSAASMTVSGRSSIVPRGLVLVAGARVQLASAQAPLALWYGAGEGRARPGLLRARLLFNNGIIDGSVFGRQVTTANVELQRWMTTPIAPMAVAGFVDIGRAVHRLPQATGDPFAIDAGAGVRLRVPGVDGVGRLDYARGLRDGAHRVTVGWVVGLR